MFKKIILTVALAATTVLTPLPQVEIVKPVPAKETYKVVVMPSQEVKAQSKPVVKAQPKKVVSSVESNLVRHMEKQKVSRSSARSYARSIVKYSKQYKVDPYTVLAMVQVESEYRPNLVGYNGDTGLMQVLPPTAREVGVRGNLKNPDTNIKAGAKYLGYTTKRFGKNLGVVAYNQGEGNVKRGRYKTTYLKKVNKVKATIRR